MTLPVSYDSQTPLEYIPLAGSVWFHDTDLLFSLGGSHVSHWEGSPLGSSVWFHETGLLLSSDSVALSGSHDQKARAHIKLVERARANRVQIPARASLFSSDGFHSYSQVAPDAVPYARVKRLQWDKPAPLQSSQGLQTAPAKVSVGGHSQYSGELTHQSGDMESSLAGGMPAPERGEVRS